MQDPVEVNVNGIPRPEPGSAVVTQEMGPQVGRQIIRRCRLVGGSWVMDPRWVVRSSEGGPQVGGWVMGQVALDGSSDYQVFIQEF